MQQTFTPELLIKHLYKETSSDEISALENALINDSKLNQEFTKLQEAKNALDESGGRGPERGTIDNILAFSKNTAAELV